MREFPAEIPLFSSGTQEVGQGVHGLWGACQQPVVNNATLVGLGIIWVPKKQVRECDKLMRLCDSLFPQSFTMSDCGF